MLLRLNFGHKAVRVVRPQRALLAHVENHAAALGVRWLFFVLVEICEQ